MYNVPTTLAENTLQGAARLFLMESDYNTLVSSSILDDFTLSNVVAAPGDIFIDLIITDVQYQIADFSKIEQHIGNTFSIDYFGMSPIIFSVSAKLIDTFSNNAKKSLVTLYEKVFRLSRVAKHKIVPGIQFMGCSAFGAFLNLNLSENSMTEDVINCTFDFLVFEVCYVNMENTGYTKYVEINFSQKPTLANITTEMPNPV